jgi:TRAP-type C4-dicarboxylate transport system permease small subunit
VFRDLLRFLELSSPARDVQASLLCISQQVNERYDGRFKELLNMLDKSINSLVVSLRWIAMTTLALMMIFITIGVISRNFFTPLVGDVEIVRLGMIVLIMFSLAYTQKIDGHISIGIIVDKFPKKGQDAFDILGHLLNIVITSTIGFIFWGVAINHKSTMKLSTDLLNIPFYPFDFIIAIGFLLWTLVALLKLLRSIQHLIPRKETK